MADALVKFFFKTALSSALTATADNRATARENSSSQTGRLVIVT
jgi:hypothetical protein